MKNFLIALAIIGLFYCNRDDDSGTEIEPENISVLIEPIETDSNFSASDKEHYVVRNTQTHLNQLLLFIGGSFSTPKNYSRICDHAASIGFDVISLSYPNNVAAAPLGSSSDQFIFDHYRDEICFGNSVSDEVEVDNLNSIQSRIMKLLQYLSLEYPDHNWGQYLNTSNEIIWNKILVSGHSQGAGHACYLAKKKLVHRVIMFSGPNDYSTFHQEPGNWLTESGATPLNQHFSLLHLEDEVVPFSNQLANLRGLGLLEVDENPTLADDLSTPFSNANALSINIFAISEHSSTTGSNAILPEIWTYLFTDN